MPVWSEGNDPGSRGLWHPEMMIMTSVDDYREKAARCRRLAAAITAPDDPAIAALLEIALEWDAKAARA
jgi:hypothetical protein